MVKYKTIDEHSNDLQVEVYGSTLKQLFKNANNCMFDNLGKVKHEFNKKRNECIWTCNNIDDDFILHSFLSENLNYYYKKGIVRYVSSITRFVRDTATYTIHYLCDECKLNSAIEIKAVTRQGFKIIKNNGIFKVRIIFDI